ncbi:M16 family metallopeptidase [Sphingobacterium cellulitidis]|uniref:Peptidase M16 n=1 Tax=Sphingobacterium cellulitidis TaxID=1768011 RepID=A0A8H9FYL4_9SPHI|nr:M16 family metallopeptidase [Sphingobacterium soli]MBA8986467.1 zinc protease [Sphingobacterium soli]OYD42654.1 peptidase M16 [Sphingobacterium cellulitidis]GGE20477.1 peptidase M16 [Sphingobacterium soli]
MKILKPLALAFLLPFATEMASAYVPTHLHSEAKVVLMNDSLKWDAKLPFDKDVIKGKLANGFQYYIRKNSEPEKRVTMFLAMKVGSILENEKELGLAHFMEHMNFNGLKHFPKNELIDYLQKAGVRFGSDLNAYTSFDETVYQLPIPSDDPELLKNGLQVMRDWAQDAMLETDEINKERGVIMEEMRGGRGAMQRMRDQYFKVMLNGSRYADRLPIGTEEVVTKFDPEVIRNFHAQWYRPDLQSLIIVGDIDPQQMEAEVKRLFSDMKVPKDLKPRTEYKVDLLNKNQFIKVTDPEMTYTVGQIMIKHPEEKVSTVKDYRRDLLKDVFNQMINARFSELGQSANPPFIQAGVDISGFIGGIDNLGAFFISKPGQFEDGFKAVVRELDRFQKFGFTETEFKRAISSIAKSNETSYTERDKRKSESYVNAYLNHFLKDGPALSNEDRYEITKQLLPTLTLKEVENVGKEFYQDINRDVIILAPDAEKDKLPEEAAVNAWFTEIDKEDLKAYEDKVSDLPMLSKTPVKGSIKSEKSIDKIETKELILSNGVKVLLKPTKFKNDQIMISAYSPGGTSLYSDADYMSASFAGNLVNSSGIGQLNTVELQKSLTGKEVNISPYITERSEGLRGSTDKESLKTAFEMIYGYFTEPRIEDDIFQSVISKQKDMQANRENDPNFVYSDAIQRTLYGNSIRRVPYSIADLDKVSKERALEIYKDRFADASDFTFVIVGSFTEDEIKPYLEEYLAALPNKGRKEQAKDLNLYEKNKGVEKIVRKGKEAKAAVRMVIYGDYIYNDQENMNASALETILTNKLIERLREDESGVYGTGARLSYSKSPKPRYTFMIGFGTSVDKYQSLINSAIDEVKKIKQNGPSQTDLDKFKIEEKRQLELNLRENGFWTSEIMGSVQNETDPTKVTKYLEDLDKVTIESVKAAANKYLKEENFYKFILLPDAAPAK